MHYIGIDIGSTSVKTVVVDPEKGAVTDMHSVPTPAKRPDPNPNTFEIPCGAILALIRQEIDRCTRIWPDAKGLLLSVQMHGFVYDVPGTEPVYVSWQDMRCLDRCEDGQTHLNHLAGLVSEEEMHPLGVGWKPALGIAKLYARFAEDPSLPGNGELHTLGSYLIHALTGKNVTHATSAAPLGIVNVKEGRIDTLLPDRLGMGEIRLPSLAGDFEVVGRYGSNGCTLDVYPDYGDGQVAMAGCGLAEGMAVCNVGTAAQVIRLGRDFTPGSYEIRPYFDGLCQYTISNMPGGRNLKVLVDFFRETAEALSGTAVPESRIWDILHGNAGEERAGRPLRVDANFYENPHFPDGGAVTGIDQHNLHMRGIFLAACRNMAETYARFIGQLGLSGNELTQVVCAGGVSWKTPELVRAVGDILQRPVCLSPMEDEAAAGILRLARRCEGL